MKNTALKAALAAMGVRYCEENLSEITEEEVQDYLENDFDYYEIPLTYEEWDDRFEYEKYEDSYTTDNGDTVVAFGYYGMDM